MIIDDLEGKNLNNRIVAIEVQHSAQNQLPLFLIPLLADARFFLWQREKNFLLF
jgi:hypothetical protein